MRLIDAMYNDVLHVNVANDVAVSVFFLKEGTVRRYELAMAISPLTICLINPVHCLRIRAFWLIPILVHLSHVLSFQFRAK